MAKHSITLADVVPLIEGLAIYGTGGGGTPEWGMQVLKNDLAHGRSLTLIDPEDVADDAFIVSGGYMGSIKTLGEMSYANVVAGWEKHFELTEAIKVSERLAGKQVNYLVPFEVGGLNCPVIMSACARLGIPCVNGDAVGRAAPETHMTSFIGHGISLTPMPLVDHVGNTIIVQSSVEPTYADELGRWVVTRGGGTGANNHYPMSGKQLKRSVIPHTITAALNLGRAIIQARETGGDPVEVGVKMLNGQLLFRGVVEEIQEEDRGGFLHTRARLAGADRWAQSSSELTIKNEVMLCMIDGKIRTVFPDLLCLLEPATGRGVMTSELRKGMELFVVGVACHPRMREALQDPIGAKALGPARFGHPDVVYHPIEELA